MSHFGECPREPTGDECNRNAIVFESDDTIGYAIWYPQMGGYAGRAVAMMDKQWVETDHGATGGCIDVFVWHDGDFPFGEGEPRVIHHCDPQAFMEFGKTLTELNDRGRRTEVAP